MKPPKNAVADTLKRLGMTYADLAVLLGVSTAAVGRWAKGTHPVSGAVQRLLRLIDNGKDTATLARLERLNPYARAARDMRKARGDRS